MAYNVPDDWGMYWDNCGECGQKYHASEGGHECSPRWARAEDKVEPKRDWLADSGYEFDSDQMTWSAIIRMSSHTARRDHGDGRIKKGQEYQVSVTRSICDDSGESWLDERKCLLRPRG